MKRVVWAGLRFVDHYHIIKNNRYIYKVTENGGIKNCHIKGVENVYHSLGIGTAHFTISKNGTDSAVNFYDSPYRSYRSLNGIECDWLHIAYIDALPGLDLHSLDLSNVKNISSDFCNSFPNPNAKEIERNLLKVDVVFDNVASGNNIYNNQELGQHKWIWHDKVAAGLQNYFTGEEIYVSNSWQLDCIFTVGAGDKWASNFIKRKLLGDTDYQAMIIAHDLTSSWLEEINESL